SADARRRVAQTTGASSSYPRRLGHAWAGRAPRRQACLTNGGCVALVPASSGTGSDGAGAALALEAGHPGGVRAFVVGDAGERVVDLRLLGRDLVIRAAVPLLGR